MFVQEYPIDRLRPADYNPRAISEESLQNLRLSISEVGMIKPVIVTADGLIIAGHQRTKTMKKIGLDNCPAFILDLKPNITDEISFNQMHNATDIEMKPGVLSVPPGDKIGWDEVRWQDINVDLQEVQNGAIERNEIMKLITSYGPWGASVVNQKGEVLISKDYAICCRILEIDLRVYRIEDEKTERVYHWFSKDYGYFSYSNLEKTTYVQTMAQPIRLRANKNNLTSYTYELFIIPYIKSIPELRILDFGAGQMDYVQHLYKQGYNIKGFEPFFRKKGKLAIDLQTIREHVDAVCYDLRTYGLYDVVICDAVINSVDSPEAEVAVLRSIAALCKPNGKIFYAGRSLYQQKQIVARAKKRCNVNDANIVFLDKDNFTATFTRGFWLYQKFHSLDDIHKMTQAHVANEDQYKVYNTGQKELTEDKQMTSYFYVVCDGRKDLDLETEIIPALRFEFDLMQPKGNSIGKADEIEAAYRQALVLEAANAQ